MLNLKIISSECQLQLATMQRCYFKKHIFFSTASVFAALDYNTVHCIIQNNCE